MREPTDSLRFTAPLAFLLSCLCFTPSGLASVPLGKAPRFTPDKSVQLKLRRGQMGTYQRRPSASNVAYDARFGLDAKTDFPVPPRGYKTEPGSHRISYVRLKKGFVGVYMMLLSDLRDYEKISFWVKAARPGLSFEIGLNDVDAQLRGESRKVGSVRRYLPEGLTTKWQRVDVPLKDFRGIDLARVISLDLLFSEQGTGKFWLDELRFHKKGEILPAAHAAKKGPLLLDDFDHSDLNLMGQRSAVFKRLPSTCSVKRVKKSVYGSRGRSLQVRFDKRMDGWCGYYSLLNAQGGAVKDLSRFGSLSFMVRSEKGGEDFEVGLADEMLQLAGDSVKAGQLAEFLPGGVTQAWKEVVIPFDAFLKRGDLDFKRMGSFVLNFNRTGSGTIFLDNIRFLPR